MMAGREVRETEPPGGPITLIMNIIWIILPGLELADHAPAARGILCTDDHRFSTRGTST